MRKSE
jgi:hypothetical protein